jgi:hypothetical protein
MENSKIFFGGDISRLQVSDDEEDEEDMEQV